MRLAVAGCVTILFVGVGWLMVGLVQMGDCYPEPDIMRACSADKTRIGNQIVLILLLPYSAILWLIFRRRKPR